MSVRVMTLVWSAPFPTLAIKLVALKLADCANDDGENVYPSARRVARDTGVSESTVRAVTADMQAAGLLCVVEASHGNRRGRSTTVRRIDIDRLRAVADGTLRWVQVPVPVARRASPAGRCDGDLAQTRAAWRLAADPASDEQPPAPPAIGGVAVAAPLRWSEGTPPVAGGDPSGERRPTPPVSGPKPSIEPSETHPQCARRAPGVCEVDGLIQEITTAATERAVRVLIEPIVRQRRLEAPDPAFALRQIAEWAGKHPDAVLAKAAAAVLGARKAVVKAADIEDALKAEIARARLAEGASSAKLVFEGSEPWRRALEQLRRERPLDADWMAARPFVTRDELADMGVVL